MTSQDKNTEAPIKGRNHGWNLVCAVCLIFLTGCTWLTLEAQQVARYRPWVPVVRPYDRPWVTTVEESRRRGQKIFWTSEHISPRSATANRTTGDILQQTLIDAFFWSQANGNARVTVAQDSDVAVKGSRILIPGVVDLVCSSYSAHTYSGGCEAYQTDPGEDTATGGSPLFMADFAYGVLANNHEQWCNLSEDPLPPGCVIINSENGSLSGFTLFGGGSSAGGNDVGVRVAANNFHVQDTATYGFFGGPGIQHVVGVNDSYDWNYGTNVAEWFCSHPTDFTGVIGGMHLPMTDGEFSNNQYSTGCAFANGFRVSTEYPRLVPIYVGGSGNFGQDNLAQTDGVGMYVDGAEHRIFGNNFEYTGREGIRVTALHSIFMGNYILSPCIDPNLTNLRPGAPNNGIPLYPTVPTVLDRGSIIMDPNGNVEEVISTIEAASGETDSIEPDWATQAGGTVSGSQLVWENMGPWTSGLTSNTDEGTPPPFVSGDCYGVSDVGQDNIWSTSQVGQEAGVNGPSYMRGSYFIAFPGALSGNICDRDEPDAYGNGQCWWGGDLFANGGPPGLQPNGETITASGGGTAWVGDYSVVMLTDTTPQMYNNFQGMSDGQFFWVTSKSAPNIITPWPSNGDGSLYGHPSLLTCQGQPLTVGPNEFYEFHYSLSDLYLVTEVGCGSSSSTQSGTPLVTLSALNEAFPAQVVGTTSSARTIRMTNSGTAGLYLSIAAAGQFVESDNCGQSIGAGASCTILVRFVPTSLGIQTASLTISDNASNSPQVVQLSGTGIPAPSFRLMVSPVALTFASQTVGTTSQPQSISITNSGQSVSPISIKVQGAFAELNTCGTSLPAGASCNASITFDPTVSGAASGALVITDSGTGFDLAVSLSGEGQTPTAVLTPSFSISSPSKSLIIAEAGGTASAAIVLNPSGGFLGTINWACEVTYQGSGVPNQPPTCSISPSTSQVLTGNASSVTLTVVTTAPTGLVSTLGSQSVTRAGLGFLIILGIVPLRRRERNFLSICICTIAVASVLSCGLTVNRGVATSQTGTTTGDYLVVLTATSNMLDATTSLPLILK